MAEAFENDSADRVGYIYHAVSREDLKPGDQIYAYRAGGIYNHHGIYIGEPSCEVIHFVGKSKLSSSFFQSDYDETRLLRELKDLLEGRSEENSARVDEIIIAYSRRKQQKRYSHKKL